MFLLMAVAVLVAHAAAEISGGGACLLVAKGPWEMGQATAPGKWMPAVVPGTVLNTLVKKCCEGRFLSVEFER